VWAERVLVTEQASIRSRNKFVQANLGTGRERRSPLPARRPAADRPHPGGQPRPHQGGQSVRSPARLPLLDLRHLVDPSRHRARAGRQGPNGPGPGPHPRGQPAHPQGDPLAVGHAGPRRRPTTSWPRRSR
jgi:hypothetical protein